MGDPKGFLKVRRETGGYRPVCERVTDYREVSIPKPEARSRDQASRCMDCGTPFCHWACPVGNYIPEWNDMAYRGRWKKAIELLQAMNNFPEFTGRVCPALCEYACVLGINDEPVTIRDNELAIIEHAFKSGLITPKKPSIMTKKSVAVIGSGPAGLAAADQLNKAGHDVTVYEKDDKPGGILRYGIPDFKLAKSVIDRRVDILKRSGIRFSNGVNVGIDIKASSLLGMYDAICLTGGSRTPRDLKIEGRGLSGVYFAMDYLTQSNKRIAKVRIPREKLIDAKGKKVLVIGGGDTGADCVGTAHRQGAACVRQIEVLPRPADCRTPEFPWPKYPVIMKTSTSHEEGGERRWAVQTKRFEGKDGRVFKAVCSRLDFSEKDARGCPVMKELPGSEFEIEADLVILAIGFLHPVHEGLLTDMGVEFDTRGNVMTGQDHMTSVRKVFAAGDLRRGQSLVVWAISEGRKAAHHIDKFLMGRTDLPRI